MYDLIDLEKDRIDMPERLYVMTERICEIIRKVKPDCVVLEDVSLNVNVSTLIVLSRLQGAVLGCCRVNKIPFDVLMPSNWRKALGFKQGQGIKRPELKKQAVEFVKTNYGLELSEDVCEAVCIGTAFMRINNIKK